jgi:hypothetical protein
MVLADRYLASSKLTIRFAGECSALVELTVEVRHTEITASKTAPKRKAIFAALISFSIQDAYCAIGSLLRNGAPAGGKDPTLSNSLD